MEDTNHPHNVYEGLDSKCSVLSAPALMLIWSGDSQICHQNGIPVIDGQTDLTWNHDPNSCGGYFAILDTFMEPSGCALSFIKASVKEFQCKNMADPA
jgi:hypothetical protein